MLFSGTIRSNLDPFGQLTDVQLYESLARVGLIKPTTGDDMSNSSLASSSNANIFRDLSTPVSESGGNLSQGQQQLLCIARSLLANSKIVVLDEPVSALDVSVQAQIVNLFADLQKSLGLTYVFIAHDLAVVRAMADRVMVMKVGKLVESGATEELMRQPQHPYTQQLIRAAML